LDLDENKILAESRKAFTNQRYEPSVFSKTKLFEDFSNYLILNSDSIIYFNQSDLHKTFSISKGIFYDFTKKGDCFTFITTNDTFLEYYVPREHIDSIKYFVEIIGRETLPSFQLCTNKDFQSIDKRFGNIVFTLPDKKEEPLNPNYYQRLYLSFNRREVSAVLKINTISESLQKDTVLTDNLKYIIRIDPYAGI
jgi:hypothetical protein